MGIKSLTQTIKKYSPDTINNENLYKLSGKKVAVDASLIIYKQLHNKGKVLTNSSGKVTSHIIGLFYKIMNYISLNIDLIFIFDGKPPINKQECINERKEKIRKNIEKANECDNEEDKKKLLKSAIRITPEMINDTKYLLKLMGISYIHPNGEAEAYASELCRKGYVDYVLTEDMDTLPYGCPKLIRDCIDSSLRRKDIVSIFTYDKLTKDLEITHEQFVEFCILCGCDYCPQVPKIGNITALKLIKKYKNIESIIENTKYIFPDNYLEKFKLANENFFIFRDKIIINDIIVTKNIKDINGLKNYLINDIGMNNKRVQNTLKKYHNKYK